MQMRFVEGNIVKYIVRAGRKKGTDAVTDYSKALHYLQKLRELHDDAVLCSLYDVLFNAFGSDMGAEVDARWSGFIDNNPHLPEEAVNTIRCLCRWYNDAMLLDIGKGIQRLIDSE
jgi:hypothetical protein